MRGPCVNLGHFSKRGAVCVAIAALGPPAVISGPGPALAARKQTAEPPAVLVISAGTPSQQRRLEDTQVGYALSYPDGWLAGGRIAATEFAAGAQCRSVRSVDFEPPPDTGPVAQMQQSFVQVCAKRASKPAPLADFMRETYGTLLFKLFRAEDLNGMPAYQTKEEGPSRTIYIQIKDYRIQIFTSVATDPETYARRRAQIEEILASLSAI